MSVTTSVYKRKRTGTWASVECCPALPTAKGGMKNMEDMLSDSLPPSKKVAVDVSASDYTVPDEMIDRVQGITVNTSGLVNLQCLNDEGSDLVYVTQGIFLRCQAWKVFTTDTAAAGIRIWA